MRTRIGGNGKTIHITRGHFKFDKLGYPTKFIPAKDGLPYARPRKPYTRSKPYPEHIKHFVALPREKTAIIKLRQFDYSINHLAKSLRRSTSWIHNILSKARSQKYTKTLRLLRKRDNRKLPRKTRERLAIRRFFKLESWLNLWFPFILGEEADPP